MQGIIEGIPSTIEYLCADAGGAAALSIMVRRDSAPINSPSRRAAHLQFAKWRCGQLQKEGARCARATSGAYSIPIASALPRAPLARRAAPRRQPLPGKDRRRPHRVAPQLPALLFARHRAAAAGAVEPLRLPAPRRRQRLLGPPRGAAHARRRDSQAAVAVRRVVLPAAPAGHPLRALLVDRRQRRRCARAVRRAARAARRRRAGRRLAAAARNFTAAFLAPERALLRFRAAPPLRIAQRFTPRRHPLAVPFDAAEAPRSASNATARMIGCPPGDAKCCRRHQGVPEPNKLGFQSASGESGRAATAPTARRGATRASPAQCSPGRRAALCARTRRRRRCRRAAARAATP